MTSMLPRLLALAGLSMCATQARAQEAAGVPHGAVPAAAKAEPTEVHESEFPVIAMGNGPRMGKRYYLARWAEDWSAPTSSDDPFASLKHIGLGAPGRYLTLNGQLRLRENSVNGPGLTDAAQTDQFLLRAHLGADLHLGRHLRLYGELLSAQMDGHNLARTATAQNDLDLLQGFVEVDGNAGGAHVGARVGRQDFVDVSPVLFSRRESLNVPLTHNGIRLYAVWPRFRLGLFELTPTSPREGTFDDHRSDTEKLRGINGSVALDAAGGRFVDPFFYRYENSAKRWGGQVGMDRRDTSGIRLWGSAGAWQYDWTLAHQSGTFAGRDVDADAIFTRTDRAIGDFRWKPRLGVRADSASGGGSYTGGTLRAFNYGVGHSPYFADNNYLAPVNMLSIAPNLSVQPASNVRITLEWAHVRRRDEQDAVYNGAGIAYAGTENVPGKDVGRIARLSGNWSLDDHLSLSTFINYVEAGDVLRRAGYRDSFYTAVWASYVF
ncbi:alginate export family protein [Stenotrophomonas tumulicola]|uniref:Alginate export family protein n=1 Tax=Stenotrophomonas tumulicola TaxID=1685415 RepID=A0A7W3FME3_9GAMM|nr:alginate export family protein [Stenotrophomonas tumulicola]MBA8682247.1 alginate export family protein [Stenotrophomonas tumulicola]